MSKLRDAFDAYLIAQVNRHGGIPPLPAEELALQGVIADLLATEPHRGNIVQAVKDIRAESELSKAIDIAIERLVLCRT